MSNPNPVDRRENLKRGNTVGVGKKPDEWKAMCAELASNDEMLAQAKEVLKDKAHGAWLGAWKFVAEQGYGKPKESIEHSGEVKSYIIIADESKI